MNVLTSLTNPAFAGFDSICSVWRTILRYVGLAKDPATCGGNLLCLDFSHVNSFRSLPRSGPGGGMGDVGVFGVGATAPGTVGFAASL